MTAASLLNKNINPTEAEVSNTLNANICRCGAHRRIIRAVLTAAKEMQKVKRNG